MPGRTDKENTRHVTKSRLQFFSFLSKSSSQTHYLFRKSQRSLSFGGSERVYDLEQRVFENIVVRIPAAYSVGLFRPQSPVGIYTDRTRQEERDYQAYLYMTVQGQ